MVRRLVEQKQLRLGQQRPHQRQHVLLAAGERPHQLLAPPREPQRVEHPNRLRRHAIAARLLVCLQRLLVGALRHRQLVARGRGETLFRAAQRPLQLVVLTEHGADDRRAFVVLNALWHVANLQPGRAPDDATTRRLLANQHAQDRGLAGPVWADQPYLLAGRDLEGDVLKHGHMAVVLDDVLKPYEFHG